MNYGEDYRIISLWVLNAINHAHISEGLYHYNNNNCDSLMSKSNLNSFKVQQIMTEYIIQEINKKGILNIFQKEIIQRKTACRYGAINIDFKKGKFIYPEIKFKLLDILYRKIGGIRYGVIH